MRHLARQFGDRHRFRFLRALGRQSRRPSLPFDGFPAHVPDRAPRGRQLSRASSAARMTAMPVA
jgi:hypothetical protein